MGWQLENEAIWICLLFYCLFLLVFIFVSCIIGYKKLIHLLFIGISRVFLAIWASLHYLQLFELALKWSNRYYLWPDIFNVDILELWFALCLFSLGQRKAKSRLWHDWFYLQNEFCTLKYARAQFTRKSDNFDHISFNWLIMRIMTQFIEVLQNQRFFCHRG